MVGCEQGKFYGDGRAASNGAFDFDFAAMQFNAAFDDGQTKSRARHLASIATTIESAEQAFDICFGNAHSMIANTTDGKIAIALDVKVNSATGGRILHGVREQVGENMLQESFIGERSLHIL